MGLRLNADDGHTLSEMLRFTVFLLVSFKDSSSFVMTSVIKYACLTILNLHSIHACGVSTLVP